MPFIKKTAFRKLQTRIRIYSSFLRRSQKSKWAESSNETCQIPHDKPERRAVTPSRVPEDTYLYTALITREVQQIQKISDDLESDLRKHVEQPGELFEMRNNSFTEVSGSAVTNFRVPSQMSVSMVGNTASYIGGDAFTNFSFLTLGVYPSPSTG